MCQISLALEPSLHWKGRNKAKLVHKTQMILHRPTVWFICTHMYIQRMDSGYSKYWPIFTSYQTLKIINKQHMLTLTISAANSFSWILSIFDIGLKRAITNQYSILFLLKSWIIKCWILHIYFMLIQQTEVFLLHCVWHEYLVDIVIFSQFCWHFDIFWELGIRAAWHNSLNCPWCLYFIKLRYPTAENSFQNVNIIAAD